MIHQEPEDCKKWTFNRRQQSKADVSRAIGLSQRRRNRTALKVGFHHVAKIHET